MEAVFSVQMKSSGSPDIYLFIYYIMVHEVQNTHIQRKIGLKNT